MATPLRIKRRSAAGAAGAPASLLNAELAFNENDKTLYYGFGDDGSGNATSIISIAGMGAFVALTGTQSVAGDKTFTGTISVPAPTLAGHAVTKSYVDGLVASASIPDGDKGDITVSGSGTVWSIDAGAVSNAKLASVATATIKGRATAGTGAPEDLTPAQVKTLLAITYADIGGSMPLDPELSALAGLTSAANKVPRYTGSGTADLLDFSTDGTLAANSDTTIPSQKSVKTYVDGLIAANDAMTYKGAINASSNPSYPAANAGDTYRISVAGKIGGASGPNVEVGDMLICHLDGSAAGTHASVGANWDILQVNIDGALTTASIGVTVQGYDATLQSLAGLATAANQGLYLTATDTFATFSLTAGGRALGGVAGTANTFPYFSAANVVTLGSITAAGRTVLAAVDATAQRTALGLGSMATQNANAVAITGGTIDGIVLDGGTF